MKSFEEQPKTEGAETEDKKKEQAQESGPESERAGLERKLEDLKAEFEKMKGYAVAAFDARGGVYASLNAVQREESRRYQYDNRTPFLREQDEKIKADLEKEFERLDKDYAIFKDEMAAVRAEFKEVNELLKAA